MKRIFPGHEKSSYALLGGLENCKSKVWEFQMFWSTFLRERKRENSFVKSTMEFGQPKAGRFSFWTLWFVISDKKLKGLWTLYEITPPTFLFFECIYCSPCVAWKKVFLLVFNYLIQNPRKMSCEVIFLWCIGFIFLEGGSFLWIRGFWWG